MFGLWMWWDMIPRRVRQWMLLLFGIVAVIGLPILGVIVGADMERWNIEGLSQSPGISPAEARAETWNWSQIWLITGLVVGASFFLVGIVYFFSREDKERNRLWR